MRHSYSSISTFEQCQKRYFHKYILREQEAQGPEAGAGSAVHAALEARVRNGTPLPPDHAHLEPWASSVATTPGSDIEVEKTYLVDRDLQPVASRDDAWIVAIADITVRAGPAAWIGDWKTGKPRENPLQLGLTAAMVFTHRPEIERVCACNIWLKTNRIGIFYQWERVDLPQLWRDVLVKCLAMEKAAEAGVFKESPGPLCAWCAVKSCRFCNGA